MRFVPGIHFLRQISQVRYLYAATFVNSELKLSVNIGDSPICTIFFFDIGTDDRFPVIVCDDSADCTFFLLLCGLVTLLFYNDVFTLNCITNILSY